MTQGPRRRAPGSLLSAFSCARSAAARSRTSRDGPAHSLPLVARARGFTARPSETLASLTARSARGSLRLPLARLEVSLRSTSRSPFVQSEALPPVAPPTARCSRLRRSPVPSGSLQSRLAARVSALPLVGPPARSFRGAPFSRASQAASRRLETRPSLLAPFPRS
jgi:hypothetical protein